MNAIAQRNQEAAAAIMERVVIGGDLSQLKPAERVMYYREVCRSIGVNPLTKPFEYLSLNNKLVLYARKDCTDQLRARDEVSVTDVVPQEIGDLYVVTVRATNGKGRVDMATGAVNIKGLAGEALANAMMKAETKAKRRATLSLCGLGMLDESEWPDIPEARRVEVDPTTGEVTGTSAPGGQDAEAIITENQVRKLSAIATGHKWSDDQVHELLTAFQYNSRKAIKAKDYDAICDRLKLGYAAWLAAAKSKPQGNLV